MAGVGRAAFKPVRRVLLVYRAQLLGEQERLAIQGVLVMVDVLSILPALVISACVVLAAGAGHMRMTAVSLPTLDTGRVVAGRHVVSIDTPDGAGTAHVKRLTRWRVAPRAVHREHGDAAAEARINTVLMDNALESRQARARPDRRA